MERLKELSKKWWFWFIIVILVFGIMGMETEDNNSATNDNKQDQENQTVKYELTGEELGDYGKEVVLNANTDLPATKYLYKLPTGKYKVTTTFEKLAAFYIVKDDVVKTGPDEYPEELNYVSEQYSLTAGDNDFNGKH